MNYSKSDMKRMYRAGCLMGLMEAGTEDGTVEKANDITDLTFEGALNVVKKEKEAAAAGRKQFDAKKALEALSKAGKLNKDSGVIMELLRPEWQGK